MKSINYAIISSLMALAVGILLMAWTEIAVIYLVIAVGALFAIPGLYGVASYAIYRMRTKRGNLKKTFPIVAVGSLLLGIWLILMPAFFVSILMYFLAILLLLVGLNQFVAFIHSRKIGRVPVIFFIIPLLVMIAGIFILIYPFQAATIPFIIAGVSAVVYSLTDLIRLFRYRPCRHPEVINVPLVDSEEEKVLYE